MVLALPTRSFLCFIHVTPTCQHVPVVPASHVLSASPSLHRSHALSAVPERDTTLPSWRRGHDISAPAHLVHRSWISVLATHVTLQMSTQVSPVSREAGGSHFIARPHPAPWRTRRITAGSAAVSHYLAAVDVRLTYQLRYRPSPSRLTSAELARAVLRFWYCRTRWIASGCVARPGSRALATSATPHSVTVDERLTHRLRCRSSSSRLTSADLTRSSPHPATFRGGHRREAHISAAVPTIHFCLASADLSRVADLVRRHHRPALQFLSSRRIPPCFAAAVSAMPATQPAVRLPTLSQPLAAP